MSPAYSNAIRQKIAARLQRAGMPAVAPDTAPAALHHEYFSVAGETRELQLPAWRDYTSSLLDIPVRRAQLASGFRGELDTYAMQGLIYLDSRTSPVTQTRSAARISNDNMRDYCFHVALEGIVETTTRSARAKTTQFTPGVLALDMNQTMTMERPTDARVLALFVPRAVVDAAIPDAEAIHGRVLNFTTPLLQLTMHRLRALCLSQPTPHNPEFERTLRQCSDLIVAAFGKQHQAGGNARAAARAAMHAHMKLYILSNLHRSELSPENVLQAFRLSRPTGYRMFEEEGGLGAYIRNCRLHEAAYEMVARPQLTLLDIALGMGFNSASDFTRAFRRVYGMAPSDYRERFKALP
jgi:AraC-like DNA-binding protein